MPIEREKLRAWVYDALAHPLQITANQSLLLNDIAGWVKQKAQQDGILPNDPPSHQQSLSKEDEDAIRECVWALTIQGLVVPGISNDTGHQANFPFLQVTEWGKSCLQKGEYLPYDTGLFLGRLKNHIPDIDRVVELYLREALNSFRSGNYLAARGRSDVLTRSGQQKKS